MWLSAEWNPERHVVEVWRLDFTLARELGHGSMVTFFGRHGVERGTVVSRGSDWAIHTRNDEIVPFPPPPFGLLMKEEEL